MWRSSRSFPSNDQALVAISSTMGFTPHPSDPFYDFMKPPEDETETQKTARLKSEADAQRRNDAIEDEIKEDRARIQRDREIVKVLLLGQSESGKSTILKNFQIRFAHAEWMRERDGWRTVVHLNVVRSINAILKVVEAGINNNFDSDDDKANADESMKFTDRHQLLLIRLAPLSIVETDLKRKLGCFSDPSYSDSLLQFATPFDVPEEENIRPRRQEFYVKSWRDFLKQEALGASDSPNSIGEYKDDMKALWNDPVVRMALKNQHLQIGDTAGFFLNDLDRVTDRNYTVTDDDVVRARLRTLGIQEYMITFKEGLLDKAGLTSGWTWRIFDVGGCRTSRRAWLPYFENVNVIIFLSPVSVFDQRLEEDPRVNRLEDSIILWTAICSSKLLAKTQLILFLNKCDLLRRKLKRGIKVNQYLPSYGDRSNDVTSVVKYLREKFKDIMKQNSPEQRQTYIYPTTATDTATTGLTLDGVRDGILRENLAASWLI